MTKVISEHRVQGIMTFPVDSLDFCHVLPVATVDAIIAWPQGLDQEFAQLSPTQRHAQRTKGIWWKRKTAANRKGMVPKVMNRLL